jgi:DNA (cytosine-5)-methyltransferase 1
MEEIKFNSYFSGAGMFDLGLSMGGLTANESFEIDKTCCQTLRNNFNHKIIQTDLQHKLVLDDLNCHVMVGTYPCTKYSAIADLFGNRTGDDLFLHMFRHIAIKQPEVYIIENVPGMKAFPVVMEAMSKLPNYYVSIFCPINANVWLPQNRERLILIGSKKPFAWTEPKKGSKLTLSDIIEKDVNIEIPKSVYSRLEGKYRDFPIISDPEKNDIAPTCLAHYHKDRSTRLIKDSNSPIGVRPYTVREYARLQGVPDSFIFCGTESEQYKQIGNGVAVPLGIWAGKQIKNYFNKVA